jgi:hypothetical protein
MRHSLGLAERVEWRAGGFCYLGDMYLGRIYQGHVGWLVLAAGEPAVTVADQDDAKAQLLQLVDARAHRFLEGVRQGAG